MNYFRVERFTAAISTQATKSLNEMMDCHGSTNTLCQNSLDYQMVHAPPFSAQPVKEKAANPHKVGGHIINQSKQRWAI